MYTSAVAEAAVSQPKPCACAGGGGAHAVHKLWTVGELAQPARVRRRVVARDQEAGRLVAHGDGQTADRGRDHRRTGRLRLYGDEPEGLAVRRHDEDGGGAEPVRELVLPDRRAEADDVRDAELGG